MKSIREISEEEINLRKLENSYKNKEKKSIISLIFGKIIANGLLICWALICLYPFLWALFSSLRPVPDMFTGGANIFEDSDSWSFYIYKSLFNDPSLEMARWLGNTIIFSLVTAAFNCVFNILAGFALAKIGMKGKKAVIYYFMVSIMIPMQATIIPTFLIVSRMGLIHPYFVSDSMFFIVLVFSGMANIIMAFMARQFFMTQSNELEEAGLIEGYSPMQIFLKVTIRRMLPLVATQFVLVFMGSWNAFLIILLFAQGNSERLTLNPAILQLAKSSITASLGRAQALAVSNLSLAPMILIYFISLRIQMRGFKGGNK